MNILRQNKYSNLVVFSTKKIWLIILIKISSFLNLEGKNRRTLKQVLLMNIQISKKNLDSNQTFCVGGRLNCKTIDIIEYEKVNPKVQKVGIFREGKYDVCGRSNSQIFAK